MFSVLPHPALQSPRESPRDTAKFSASVARENLPAWGKFGLIALVMAVSTGCATNRSASNATVASSAAPGDAVAGGSGGETASETGGRMASDMARQPLRDIGMMKRTIPAALTRISDPYGEPSGPGCTWLNYEIAQLDEALGPDPAAARAIDDRSMGEKGQEAAKTAAGQAVRGAAASLMPARGLVRFISGAEKADRQLREAKERGMVRRGYLRGLAKAQNCPSVTATASVPPPR
jgi:hypothetical protein